MKHYIIIKFNNEFNYLQEIQEITLQFSKYLKKNNIFLENTLFGYIQRVMVLIINVRIKMLKLIKVPTL